MALSKDKIVKHAGKHAIREVHVPEWVDEDGDDVVIVRGMSIGEFELNQARAADGKATAMVLARCIVDGDGNRIFSDSDAGVIAKLPMAGIQRLSQAVASLSFPDDAESVDDAVEDAVKDSPETTSSDSVSG